MCAALDVLGRRDGWTDRMLALVEKWLGQQRISHDKLSTIRGILLARVDDAKVQATIGKALAPGMICGILLAIPTSLEGSGIVADRNNGSV